MSHTAEKCSFIDYYNKVLCTDCSIDTYCINTKGMTHIKTEYLLSTYCIHRSRKSKLCFTFL